MSHLTSHALFGFRLYAHLVGRAWFGGASRPRLTAGRVARLLRLTTVFTLTQAWNRCCLALDDLLFPGYRDIAVKEPIFVCGMPRCGTTLLHRVLASDEQTTSFRLWELLLAPSICQRRFYRALGHLDRALGGYAKRGVRSLFLRAASEMRQYHPLDLWEAEEDDLVLMPHVASGFLFFPFPYYDLLRPLLRFDDDMPHPARTALMERYRALVQRHLYVYGPEKRFLSKNPMMSPKVVSLREAFPDARIICNVRTPYEAVPSMLSLFRYMIGFFRSPGDSPEIVETQLAIADYFYAHPMGRLPEMPEAAYAFVRYPDLVGDLQGTVEALYARLGLPISPVFRERLAALHEASRKYKSRHAYSLEEFGVSRDTVTERYRAVFETFAFERDAPAITPRELQRENAVPPG